MDIMYILQTMEKTILEQHTGTSTDPGISEHHPAEEPGKAPEGLSLHRPLFRWDPAFTELPG